LGRYLLALKAEAIDCLCPFRVVSVATDWGYRVGEEVEFDSWNHCVAALLESGGYTALYRGHRRFNWDLESHLERALREYTERWNERTAGLTESMATDEETTRWTLEVEAKLTQRFRLHAERFEVPDLPPARDRLGWWELMQHHGAPTRLMDWSRSPFVAIWFALDHHQDGGGDMALWVYDQETAMLNLGSVLQRLKQGEDYGFIDDRRYLNRLVTLALEEKTPVLIPLRPRPFPRAIFQQSVLTLSTRVDTGLPAFRYLRKNLATRIRLKEEWKSEMSATLKSMGLTRLGLFRDLDTLGKDVKARFVENLEDPPVI
jgi:hypothetical protein